MHSPDSPYVKKGFYPPLDQIIIEVDPNKPDWLWLVLLPFLDISLLRSVYRERVVGHLSETDQFRSRTGENELIIHESSSLKEYQTKKTWEEIKDSFLFGFAKSLNSYPPHLEPLLSGVPVNSKWATMNSINCSQCFSIAYKFPDMKKAKNGLLKGAILIPSNIPFSQRGRSQNHASTRQINYVVGESLQEKRPYNSQQYNNQQYNNQQYNDQQYNNQPYNNQQYNNQRNNKYNQQHGQPYNNQQYNRQYNNNQFNQQYGQPQHGQSRGNQQQPQLPQPHATRQCSACMKETTGVAFCTKCGVTNEIPSQQNLLAQIEQLQSTIQNAITPKTQNQHNPGTTPPNNPALTQNILDQFQKLKDQMKESHMSTNTRPPPPPPR